MDANEQLADLRRRVRDGQPITAAEYAIVIEALREGRKASASVTKPKKEKVEKAGKVAPMSLDAIFGKLPSASEPPSE